MYEWYKASEVKAIMSTMLNMKALIASTDKQQTFYTMSNFS